MHKLAIFLPVGSPDLNPIEPVWKSIKWESSPLIVNGEDEYRALLDDLFDQLTEKLSFASSWIGRVAKSLEFSSNCLP